jgi:ABC-type multidrug transport system ATPase subunit
MNENGGVVAENLGIEIGGKPLLDSISLALPPGSFTSVIGSSGCGKSTFIKCLSGILTPTSGSVLLGGHNVRTLSESLPLAIGYLPQFGAFHPELTVQEILEDAINLRLPHSVTAETRAAWLNHIIELGRISSVLNQPYSTLSGGQMRRVALAEELIGDPPFLFLDELTSGLDEYSDREIMRWLRELAHKLSKTIVLVTHATYHLDLCDSVVFLHQGRLAYHGTLRSLLDAHSAGSVADALESYESGRIAPPEPMEMSALAPEPQELRTAAPPTGWRQFPTILHRQVTLFLRDKPQIVLQLALAILFPLVVAVFALQGLPQVRSLGLALNTNVLLELHEQLLYLRESIATASLVSGLAMFQVILLTLMGANNGAREIAKEREVLKKELRVGLSPAAYVGIKFLQVAVLSAVQAVWMGIFVKSVCGFPGALSQQIAILFATTLAMGATCLAISAASPSPERASLLSIYLVGFQLPLSGAALALPEWLSMLCRPFIAAYWGWSGYLRTFEMTRQYDVVEESTKTFIAPYGVSLIVLTIHIVAALLLTAWFVGGIRRT